MSQDELDGSMVRATRVITVLQKAVCLSIFSAATLLGLDANATLLLSGDVGGTNPFCVTDQASCTQSGTTLDDVDAGLGGFVVPTFGVANVVVNGLQATATIAGTTNTVAFLIGSVVNKIPLPLRSASPSA